MAFFILLFLFGGVFNLEAIWILRSFVDERLSCMKMETECAIIFLEDALVTVNNTARRKNETQKKNLNAKTIKKKKSAKKKKKRNNFVVVGRTKKHFRWCAMFQHTSLRATSQKLDAEKKCSRDDLIFFPFRAFFQL